MMIDKINNNQISNILKDSSSKQSNVSNAEANSQADASLQVSYGSLVEKAKQIPSEDVDAVERARQMLLSGELDSPENIRKAAENIAKFGI
jgi:arginine utilization protein RocB